MHDKDKLIIEFTGSYMEKLFYFCLKKTGDSYEAEDLTSDISLCIFGQLRKGIHPVNFSAWVWQIARNRYSVWATNKHRKNESVSGADIGDFELEDVRIIENEYVHSEDLSLLRRELAFISSDYREIVVAYYIDDRSIKNIASSLDLPKGTVMSKLFRARNILKEGISMAREFGVMSYKPENVGFIMNGICGKYGEPWTIINHKLCKNILLAAYRTPSTAQELAIELGVALPYMEDELEKMVDATLLRKNGDQYETNIFIVSAQAQERIYSNLLKISPELTKAMCALLEYEAKCNDENGSEWNEGYQPYEDMKWALLMMVVDRVNFGVLHEYEKQKKELPPANIGSWGHTIRPNGGEWDLLGLEEYTGARPEFVGLHGCINSSDYHAEKEYIDFGQFKFNYKRICDATPMNISYEEARALTAAVNGDTSGVSEKTLDTLVGYGYLKKSEAGYIPDFLVIKKDKIKPRSAQQEAEHRRLFDNAKNIGFCHYMFCRGVICAEIPDYFKNDLYQIDHACANIYEMRGAVLEEALRTGFISYTQDDEKKMLGAYLTV